jgi:two-component system LytT family sensor kinase
MISPVRKLRSHAPTRFAVVLWCFVNLLSDLVTVLIGRGPPLLMFVVSIPMFATGVAFTLLLNKWRLLLAGRAALVYWALILALLVGVSLTQAFVDLFHTRWVALSFYAPWKDWALDLSLQRILTVALLYFWVFSFGMALLWAGSVSDMARYNAAKATAMEAAAFRAEATALRFQLNPHFLFNTLNSLAGTIAHGSRQQAEGMVLKLASFLRASFDSDPAAMVTVEEEVASMEAYLDIENVRFGERMQVDIHIDDDAEAALVPHFILQPLVENAVKHGVARTSRQVHLTITGECRQGRIILRVVNKVEGEERLQARLAAAPGTGLGLANVRQRLSLAYEDDASLRAVSFPGGFTAEIDLPFAAAKPDAPVEEPQLLRVS